VQRYGDFLDRQNFCQIFNKLLHSDRCPALPRQGRFPFAGAKVRRLFGTHQIFLLFFSRKNVFFSKFRVTPYYINIYSFCQPKIAAQSMSLQSDPLPHATRHFVAAHMGLQKCASPRQRVSDANPTRHSSVAQPLRGWLWWGRSSTPMLRATSWLLTWGYRNVPLRGSAPPTLTPHDILVLRNLSRLALVGGDPLPHATRHFVAAHMGLQKCASPRQRVSDANPARHQRRVCKPVSSPPLSQRGGGWGWGLAHQPK